jgi:dolichol-phosphate mannosyltransferase
LKYVTILLPTLNESLTLGKVIDSIPFEELKNEGYVPSILVVDGNSTDDTIRIAVEKGARVMLQANSGKGEGIKLAFQNIDSDYTVMLDADGTYPSEKIPQFLRVLEEGWDVVMGSRMRLGRISMGMLHYFGNKFLTSVASNLFGEELSDLCTGMWGFSRKAIKRLGSLIEASEFDIEADIFAKSLSAGLKITEIEIEYGKRPEGSESHISVFDGFQIVSRLFSDRLHFCKFYDELCEEGGLDEKDEKGVSGGEED